MKVWVITYYEEHEGTHFHGIYSTEEIAKAYVLGKLDSRNTWSRENEARSGYMITETEVLEEIL